MSARRKCMACSVHFAAGRLGVEVVQAKLPGLHAEAIAQQQPIEYVVSGVHPHLIGMCRAGEDSAAAWRRHLF